MLKIDNILVVIDPYHNEQAALDKAQMLAMRFDAKLVLCSSIYDNSYDVSSALNADQKASIKDALIAQQTTFIQSLAHKYLRDVEYTCVVTWSKRIDKGILNVAIQETCDLIVKSTKPHEKLGQRIFTPTDWHLLRSSPVNVLMVKNHPWTVGGNIVCAVSVDDNDEQHQCLSELVSESTHDVADIFEGCVHLVNTFTGAPVHISIEVPQFSASIYNTELKNKHTEKMQALAKRHKLSDEHLYVEEGMPEDVVPRLCQHLDAQLLVVGSVGRRGLSAALLGNTAEHIIDKIACDTLVIKP